MKKIRFIQLTIALLVITASAFGQNNHKKSIHISSARFATSLVEKWITEFNKKNPEFDVILSTNSSDSAVDLQFIGPPSTGTSELSDVIVTYTGRYVLLPITNEENPLLQELNKKRLNSKRLKELFFLDDPLGDFTNTSKKTDEKATIYSGNQSSSFANLFALHFGYTTADIKGKKIAGDDIYLNNAILKDLTSATFNHLNYIFDIETRKLKDGLALLPLDIKKGQHEILKTADIDQTIALLEEESIPLIPVGNMGFAFRKEQTEAKEFLYWVLTEGQRYNHAYGFLKTEADHLVEQLRAIEDPRYASSN